MVAFSGDGKRHFALALAAGLKGPYEAWLLGEDAVLYGPFPVDYVKADDQDPANAGKGPFTVTFRTTVPAGYNMPPACTGAAIKHGGSVLFKQPINHFRASASHASVLYINFVLGDK